MVLVLMAAELLGLRAAGERASWGGEPTDIARGFTYPMEQEHATGSVLLIDGGTLVMG
jgi:hypothetical protein